MQEFEGRRRVAKVCKKGCRLSSKSMKGYKEGTRTKLSGMETLYVKNTERRCS